MGAMDASRAVRNKSNLTSDTLAYLLRRLSRGRGRKLGQMLFRYYPSKAGTTIIEDFDGDLKISLDRGSVISSAIYWAGHHSLPLVKFLRGFLKPEMTVADVGANIGEVTLYSAKRLSLGRVLSFEPVPGVFQQLSENVALNAFGNVEMFNVGLYDRDGVLPLYLKDDDAYGLVNEGVGSVFGSPGDKTQVTIPLRKFDDLAQEIALNRLDFLKIDVEGAELMVLKGAESSLRAFRPVIVTESSAANQKLAGYSARDLYEYLGSLGYELSSLETGDKQLPDE
jgi:FkbM family methyltransferase